jgi:hypothetical protein
VTCTNYNTQTLSTAGWTRVTCNFTTSGSTGDANARLIIRQAAATDRLFYLDNVQLETTAVTGYGAGTLQVDALVTAPLFFQNAANSTAALVVNSANGTGIFTVDSLNGYAQIGSATTDAVARLFVLDSYNNGTDPTGVNGAIYYNTSLSKFRCYQGGWTDCIGAAGSSTKRVGFVPEFEGAVLQGDGGGDNSGIMTAGNSSSHNYYQWESDQSSAQDYQIVLRHQLPSDFNATNETVASSWRFYAYTSNMTYTAATVNIKDASGTTCVSADSIEPGSNTTWAEATIATDPDTACTFAANDVITITITVSAQLNAGTAHHIRIGEFRYEYAT